MTVPRFQLAECYEFMLFWPLQGVILATVPVAALVVLIMMSFSEFGDVMRGTHCSYDADELLTESIQEYCKSARTGSALMIGGFMMLWSGSKLLIPRLREVELRFLHELSTQELAE